VPLGGILIFSFNHTQAKEGRIMERFTSIVCRILFVVAFVLLAFAILERLIRFLAPAFTVLYDPGRLAEFSAIALIFVIALQLREIKKLLQK
jgi:nucleoside permease NupC